MDKEWNLKNKRMNLYNQIKYNGYHINIYYDDDAGSPRKMFDNLGTLYTAHRRYRPEKEFDEHFDIDKVFDGRIGHGALKHGNYISESACGIKQYLSPLYRARICVEELPESCRFMKSLRVKLRSDPDFGKAISQVGSYLKFRQS